MAQRPAIVEYGDHAWTLGRGLVVVLGALLVSSAITQPFTDLVVGAGLVAADGWMETVVRTVFQFVGFGAAVGGYLALADDWDLIGVDRLDVRSAAIVAVGTVVLLAIQFAALFVFARIGVSTGENQAILAGQSDPTYFLYMIAVSILFVGPGEELLFRGAVQGLFRRSWGPWPSIITASVIFGAIHVPAVVGAVGEAALYAVVAAGLGCVLGYLYERTGNVIVPCLVHGLYNGAIYAIQYVSQAM
ncbi:CPBP family intramembrane glutamic endopeptidase [Halopenitus persicus]|uniref:CAAX prenyl protease 2/Lysostaphin resistance protein A-like domain-containing protein n=1 Tax=Halopenitus persicus TaxID=1048396 RepID=A0A1H3EH71_9EURY|nr:CPBP family intramembrane glutamic endopeptidase [Halopenitus persicus]QHS17538.1 CPBP family intramembrane metalloprotease [haloarchaeon 3A1-DGR]SDX77274.1 hypothetical protein SAMN05216564_101414 [Halopenitus persicus]